MSRFDCEGASSRPDLKARACHRHTVLGVRAFRPCASFCSRSGSPSPLPSAWEAQAVYGSGRSVASLWGRMLAVGSLQKGAPWALWNQELPGMDRPTFWSLLCQAVSRPRPKSWPGSLGDTVTFPKGGFLGEAKWCLPLSLPASFSPRGDRQLMVPGWEPRGALTVHSAKCP